MTEDKPKTTRKKYIAAVHIGTEPPIKAGEKVTKNLFTDAQWEALTASGAIVEE